MYGIPRGTLSAKNRNYITSTIRHRAKKFLSLLRIIERSTPQHLELHLIMDNYAIHKTKAVQKWLKKHPRVHFRFTPTSASWLNQVKRFFAQITDKRIRRGVFRSVPKLQQAIMDYLGAHNAEPKPFI